MTDDRLRADHVTLTPLALSDADEMVTVLGDGELYLFTGGTPPALAELRARYRRQLAGSSADGRQQWRNWIVRDRDSRAVGYVQATIVDEGRQAEIAWVIGRAWWGKGYASEAARAVVGWLDNHGVRSIQAHINPRHLASAAVARRAGLTPTNLVENGELLWQRELPPIEARPA